MALFAIGDTHLSLGEEDKPMDVFNGWEGYLPKLERNWRTLIKPEDTVLLAGDISWAMSLEDTKADFAFLQSQKKDIYTNFTLRTSGKGRKTRPTPYFSETAIDNFRFLCDNIWVKL